MPTWVTVPNLLTLLRIVLTPWIGLLIAMGNYSLALPLLFLAGLTDAADGFLARRFGMNSALGARLDPVADKLLAGTVFVALAMNGALPWWYVGLALGRDALILGFAGWAMAAGLRAELRPTVWGKLSTVLQVVLACLVVLRGAMGLQWLEPAIPAALWASAAMTAWSGVHYAAVGIRMAAGDRVSLD